MQLIKASGSVTPSALVMGTKDAATNKADSFAQKNSIRCFYCGFLLRANDSRNISFQIAKLNLHL